MSEKEQVEAIKLLREWLGLLRDEPDEGKFSELATLIDKTEKFLALEEPESHGERRG